ncbi:MAG: hypothetical protein OEV01_10555, partial [Nitrospira sp.]|nr:hypothetical protein [Nitrospira sp.]
DGGSGTLPILSSTVDSRSRADGDAIIHVQCGVVHLSLTFPLVLTTHYGILDRRVGFYILPFAIGKF